MKEFWDRLSTVAKVGLIGALLGYTVGMAAVVIAARLEGLVVVALCTALVVFCFWFFFGREFRSSRIRREGLPARATILEVRSTGIVINNVYPQIELLLEVQPEDGKPYRARTKCLIDQADIPTYQPGNVIEVTVDRKNRKKIAVGTAGGAI
jgi:hypothetical protein